MKPLALEENEVLFGADPTEGIVAVEPMGGGGDAPLYPSGRASGD